MSPRPRPDVWIGPKPDAGVRHGPGGPPHWRLVVVSHVPHYFHGGLLWAFGPYAREIDLWADLFDEVLIAAPCRYDAPPRDCVPFTRDNLRMRRQRETGGRTLRAKVRQLFAVPGLIFGIGRALLAADVAHVRCPGNLGLLGALLAPALCRRHIAKYAGQWCGYRHEPWSERLERAVLRSRFWRRGIVTVYGEWPGQPAHVVSFFTSMMSREQVQAASRAAGGKGLGQPPHVLYAGRLMGGKRVDLLIEAARLLRLRGLDFRLSILGDGPDRPALEAAVRRHGLEDRVSFAGAVPYEEMLRWYERSEVLVLPSSHEGWPKVLTEAMCHGLVCVAADCGIVPRMLQGRGHVFAAGDSAALAECLERALTDAEAYARFSRAGAAWAAAYSREDLQAALTGLMEAQWRAAS